MASGMGPIPTTPTKTKGQIRHIPGSTPEGQFNSGGFGMARVSSNSSLTSSVASDTSRKSGVKPPWNGSTRSVGRRNANPAAPVPTSPTKDTFTSHQTTSGTGISNNNIINNHIAGVNPPRRTRPSTPTISNTAPSPSGAQRPHTPAKRPSTPSSIANTNASPPKSVGPYNIQNNTSTAKQRRMQQQQPSRGSMAGLPPAGPPGGVWASSARHRHNPGKVHPDVLRDMYETLLRTPSKGDRELREALKTLRKMICEHGLPNGAEILMDDGSCSLRGRIWKILLGIYRMKAQDYVSLIQRGASEVHDKIRNDTFRTLATDRKFLARVDEGMLSRVLNAFVWKLKDRPHTRLINLKYSYVQGMNVLAAPFLYVMPELDAFYSFASFIQNTCPLYVQPALEGVHCGLKLMDKCLKVADYELYSFLKHKKLSATVYAFPSIMTFCACTQPLDELCKLWDFLFAYGVHLNVLCVVVQITHIRHELLNAPSPMRLLRTLPDLNAKQIIEDTLRLIPLLHEDLYDMLVRHPFDPTIHDVVLPEREGDDDSDEDKSEQEEEQSDADDEGEW
ncbi:hypothetical protein SmJEL517_g00942 [Synchytrium microbalum]|uniref:Rab-GAP TBC domain-containing protein n=1 Tax=Synchytrium microbalum TaxID=1806994 RepID=A0A507C6A1_9FUNG|nr:uncharacterized protein SmJEL517_g00942 [Synchytrium microbalum]TPX37120.1 hypothetical protein SmJEL517_g00942 [Synchytrium microbalum]